MNVFHYVLVVLIVCSGGSSKMVQEPMTGTPLISGSVLPAPPPYLKVWIRHWFVPLEHSLSSLGLGANHLIRKLSWKEWAEEFPSFFAR